MTEDPNTRIMYSFLLFG